MFWFDVWFSRMDPGRIGIGTACEDCVEVDIMIDAKHPGHPCHLWKVEKNIRMML